MISLRISGIRDHDRGFRIQGLGNGVKLRDSLSFLLRCALYPLSCILLLASCAPKHVALPSYEGVPVETALAELRKITSIETVLSVEYERSDGTMSGDAALTLSENNLDLRIYYLGFLAGEVRETDGIIQSKPNLDGYKKVLLVEGLKNSFLWWNIRDYTVEEHEGHYVLRNSYREVVINRKTLLPVRQTVELEDGETLRITYDSPVKAESEKTDNREDGRAGAAGNVSSPLSPSFTIAELWYPSELRIELRKYVVRVKVKSYSVTGQ